MITAASVRDERVHALLPQAPAGRGTRSPRWRAARPASRRPCRTTKPTSATTPSQPISGTGRPNDGCAISDWMNVTNSSMTNRISLKKYRNTRVRVAVRVEGVVDVVDRLVQRGELRGTERQRPCVPRSTGHSASQEQRRCRRRPARLARESHGAATAASWHQSSPATTAEDLLVADHAEQFAVPYDLHRPVGREHRAYGLAHHGVRRQLRPVEHVVRRGRSHDPLQREHVRAGHVADEVAHVVVRGRADQLVTGADLHDLAVAHDQDAVAQLERLGQVVGDEHHRLADLAVQPDDLVLHVAADQRVQRGERLVEEQHVRVARERAGQTDALLHAAGELVRIGLLVAGEPDQLDDLLRALRRSASRTPRISRP